MEQTDVCYPIPACSALQEAVPNRCPAKALRPSHRHQLALQTLVGTQTITDLANVYDVSRKFVYQQVTIADQALTQAFAAPRPTTGCCFVSPSPSTG
jgi:hypothetical protein